MEYQQIIRQMLDNIESDNAAAAQENFDTVMSARINDLLDHHKQVIAQNFGAQESEMTTEEESEVDEVYNPVSVKKGTRRNVDSSGKVTYSGGMRVRGSGANSAGKIIGHQMDVKQRQSSMWSQKHPVLSKIKQVGQAASKAIDTVASIKVANKNRAGG